MQDPYEKRTNVSHETFARVVGGSARASDAMLSTVVLFGSNCSMPTPERADTSSDWADASA
ncbi:UNVERIFIED_ORG: hypothetical protein QOE_4431 [Clostridioides difficile F501]